MINWGENKPSIFSICDNREASPLTGISIRFNIVADIIGGL
jgi:hypothetical protein